MIRFDQVSVTYPGAAAPILSDVNLHIPEGELCLVVGRTGSGKSTLLRAVNGLVPHFTGGTLRGRVTVAGRDTATHPPRDLADVVGVVGQDPINGFVTDVVEEELAYGMESLGLPGDVMRRRVEETLDLLGLADLRDRALSTLSGGQRQRVAIGSVLTTHPSVLVLDEPTSALDPPAAEEVLAALQRLVHDLGITVLLAEHRLERVVQYADRLVHVPGGGAPLEIGDPAHLLASTPVAPPVVELGRLVGWNPLPLTIRDARRQAGDLRERLRVLGHPAPPVVASGEGRRSPDDAGPDPGERIAHTRELTVRYGAVLALQDANLDLHDGEVVAVMGRNGSGKSTLLRAMTGGVRPTSGAVELRGTPPASMRPKELIRHVGLVPQEPADLLYAETVEAECREADGDADMPAGTCQALLERLVPGLDPSGHPRDLSEGQRLGLVLAIVLTSAPPLLLLDEPTRGLDYAAKGRLIGILRELAEVGHAIVLATHDVELAAAVATRTIVLADGEVVVDGPTEEVVVGSPAFAPQIAKVLAPLPWLTVEQVAASLEVVPS
jgi:energy-coupling factor transport system ATP-binding protein